MRTVKRLVTCDFCGNQVEASEVNRSGFEWLEMRVDSFGTMAARDGPVLDICPYCYKRLERTMREIQKEADMFRSMDDEKLAESISKFAFCTWCPAEHICKVEKDTTECADVWLTWLKSPVEVDDGT